MSHLEAIRSLNLTVNNEVPHLQRSPACVCVCARVRVCVRMRMYLWKVQELEADHIAAAVDTGKTLQWQHI